MVAMRHSLRPYWGNVQHRNKDHETIIKQFIQDIGMIFLVYILCTAYTSDENHRPPIK